MIEKIFEDDLGNVWIDLDTKIKYYIGFDGKLAIWKIDRRYKTGFEFFNILT